MLVRAKARCFKKLRTEFHVREAASFSDDKVGCRRIIVIEVEYMDLYRNAAWEYITLE